MENEYLVDCRLSWKAKGLFTYFLSVYNGGKIYGQDLIKNSTDGMSSLESGINELLMCGYITRNEAKDFGKFDGYDYEVKNEMV